MGKGATFSANTEGLQGCLAVSMKRASDIPRSGGGRKQLTKTLAYPTAGTDKLVIKAQVLAGGRGKGHFAGPGGLQGGVHMIET